MILQLGRAYFFYPEVLDLISHTTTQHTGFTKESIISRLFSYPITMKDLFRNNGMVKKQPDMNLSQPKGHQSYTGFFPSRKKYPIYFLAGSALFVLLLLLYCFLHRKAVAAKEFLH